MKIVIVTGMSGAGKSTALNMLEDEDIIVLIICLYRLYLNLRSWQTVREQDNGYNNIALGVDKKRTFSCRVRVRT